MTTTTCSIPERSGDGRLAATLPERFGDGRFAATGNRRELQDEKMAAAVAPIAERRNALR
jgi:hypothetical protein